MLTCQGRREASNIVHAECGPGQVKLVVGVDGLASLRRRVAAGEVIEHLALHPLHLGPYPLVTRGNSSGRSLAQARKQVERNTRSVVV